VASLVFAAAVAVSGTGADAREDKAPGSVDVLWLAAEGGADPDASTGPAEPGDPAPSGEEPDPADGTVPGDAPIGDDEVAPDDEPAPDDAEDVDDDDVDVDAEDEDADAEDEEPRPAPGPTTPAVRSSTIPLGSILLAVVVLLVGAIALTGLAKRRPHHRQPASAPATPLRGTTAETDAPGGPELPAAPSSSGPPSPSTPPPLPRPGPGVSEVERVDRGTLDLLLEVGRALIDSGDAVGNVQDVLQRIAAAYGAAQVGIMVLPTALIVSIPQGGSVETEVAPAGQRGLRLDQVDEVVRIATAAEQGQLTPAEGIAAIGAARERPPPTSDRVRLGGYVLLTVGLAMLLRGGALELTVATGLGAAVGALQLASHRLRGSYQPVLPVLTAFAVAAAVFGLGRLLPELAVFPPLVAPLIAFLPGAVLTTAVFELSTGHVISGSGRLAAGMLRLVLLALGILAAAQLLGVPAAQVTEATSTAVSVLEPWVGVAVFGIGVVVFHGIRRASWPWILVVLYVAYAGQVLGGLFFGATLSAFFGALAMTPVAMLVARQEHGPPPLVSFMPGFWLLVPGALGLAGVTSFLDEDRLQGIDSLVTMGTSMVGIALGVLLGLVVGGELTARLLSRPRPDDGVAG
jgi:uncharacterized membrane protein YjjP (DUF1212 family)/uncharacterized membrane protein YjjB (DUF3815 family)